MAAPFRPTAAGAAGAAAAAEVDPSPASLIIDVDILALPVTHPSDAFQAPGTGARKEKAGTGLAALPPAKCTPAIRSDEAGTSHWAIVAPGRIRALRSKRGRTFNLGFDRYFNLTINFIGLVAPILQISPGRTVLLVQGEHGRVAVQLRGR